MPSCPDGLRRTDTVLDSATSLHSRVQLGRIPDWADPGIVFPGRMWRLSPKLRRTWVQFTNCCHSQPEQPQEDRGVTADF